LVGNPARREWESVDAKQLKLTTPLRKAHRNILLLVRGEAWSSGIDPSDR